MTTGGSPEIEFGNGAVGAEVIGNIRYAGSWNPPQNKTKWKHVGTATKISKTDVPGLAEVEEMATDLVGAIPDPSKWAIASVANNRIVVEKGQKRKITTTLSVPTVIVKENAALFVDVPSTHWGMLLSSSLNLTLERGARLYVNGTGISISGIDSLTIKEDAVLYVAGGFQCSGTISLNDVQGTIVFDKTVQFNTPVNDSKGLSTLTIVSMDSATYEQAGNGAVTLIAKGDLSLAVNGSPRAVSVYGRNATVNFNNNQNILIQPARFVGYDSLTLNFNGKKVTLDSSGDSNFGSGDSGLAGYSVAKWKEGK